MFKNTKNKMLKTFGIVFIAFFAMVGMAFAADPVITGPNSGNSPAAVNAAENQTAVTTVTATDSDAGDTITYGITGGADGVTTVSSAGTDVVLASSTACKKIDIQAQTDNTGLIAVGFTGVDATEATGTGVILNAGDSYSLEVNNLNPSPPPELAAIAAMAFLYASVPGTNCLVAFTGVIACLLTF